MNLVFQKGTTTTFQLKPKHSKNQHQSKYLFKISRKDHSCIQQVRRSQKSRFHSVLAQILRPLIKNIHMWVELRNQWVRGTIKTSIMTDCLCGHNRKKYRVCSKRPISLVRILVGCNVCYTDSDQEKQEACTTQSKWLITPRSFRCSHSCKACVFWLP